MSPKEKLMDDWAFKAYECLDSIWRDCNPSGADCAGLRCPDRLHRAMVYLARIMDEVSQ